MATWKNKSVRLASTIFAIALICYSINKAFNIIIFEFVEWTNQKGIFEYPIYEAIDDPTIVLLKVSIDVLIIVCSLIRLLRTSKNKNQRFMVVLILLKCFDILIFVFGAGLMLHNLIDNIFEETSSIFMFAVFLSTGYWVFCLLIYCFWKFRNEKNPSRASYTEHI